MTISRGDEQQGFVHSALFYQSQQEYLDFVVGFVVDGLFNDEPVMVAVPGDKLALLRDELHRTHDDALLSGLELTDIAEVALNPNRFMAVEGSFVAAHPGRRVRIVNQLGWPGRSANELLACTQHEALVNEALEGHDVSQLCLYDATRLDEDVLVGARTTHPFIWKCGSAYRSSDYAPHVALAQCNQPLPAHPGAVTYTVRKSADLRPARSFALDYADWIGLSREGTEDLQMVATELATNSLLYTDGACQLAFWRHDDHLVCEARDSGQFNDHLVGRLPPGFSGTDSRGLFLVNAMADLVRTHTTTAGTTIRAYLRYEPSATPTS